MPPDETPENRPRDYVVHFLKFLGMFVVIIGISVFVFQFTLTDEELQSTKSNNSERESAGVEVPARGSGNR